MLFRADGQQRETDRALAKRLWYIYKRQGARQHFPRVMNSLSVKVHGYVYRLGNFDAGYLVIQLELVFVVVYLLGFGLIQRMSR